MKSFILSLCLGIATQDVISAQDTNFNSILPTSSSTIIVVGPNNWSLEELNNVAITYLRQKESLLKRTKLRPIVHIFPRDKNTMCEFLYVQGFEQPYWRIRFGYDGKVQSFERTLKKEGH
jgi:hypothetical protein